MPDVRILFGSGHIRQIHLKPQVFQRRPDHVCRHDFFWQFVPLNRNVGHHSRGHRRIRFVFHGNQNIVVILLKSPLKLIFASHNDNRVCDFYDHHVH